MERPRSRTVEGQLPGRDYDVLRRAVKKLMPLLTERRAGETIRTAGSRDALLRLPIATDLIYGLINVPTDGTRVLCGYMKEGGNDFDIQVFRGSVEP